MKKKIIFIFCVILGCVITTIFSYADWVENGQNWQYMDNGELVKKDFKLINGVYYYFDENGNMASGVTEIDYELYAFNDDGTPMKDGIEIEGNIYKVSLKGKVVGLSSGYDIMDYIRRMNEKKAEEARLEKAENDKELSMEKAGDVESLSNYLGTCTDGEIGGWNKIGDKYRYVNFDTLLKNARKYETIEIADMGMNTIYFDDDGNVVPLKFSYSDDHESYKLVLQEGQLDYFDSDIYICGICCPFDYGNKSISVDCVEDIEEEGFDMNHYHERIFENLQYLVD